MPDGAWGTPAGSGAGGSFGAGGTGCGKELRSFKVFQSTALDSLSEETRTPLRHWSARCASSVRSAGRFFGAGGHRYPLVSGETLSPLPSHSAACRRVLASITRSSARGRADVCGVHGEAPRLNNSRSRECCTLPATGQTQWLCRSCASRRCPAQPDMSSISDCNIRFKFRYQSGKDLQPCLWCYPG